MKSKLHVNSLIFKIVTTVIIGSIGLAVLLSFLNISISKQVFVNHFAESQKKIFNQFDSDFYDFFGNMTEIIATLEQSPNLNIYFSEDQDDVLEDMNNRYQLGRTLKQSTMEGYDEIRVFALGEDEKSYMYSRSDMFAVSKSEIWESDVGQKALQNPGKIICTYRESGFTNVSKSSPVMILAKAWSTVSGEEADVIAFITIKESDIRQTYSHFTSSTSDIVILNQDNQVVSSNNPEYLTNKGQQVEQLNEQIGTMAEKGLYQKEVSADGNIRMYLMQKLQSTDYKVMGIINPNEAFQEQYNIWNLVWATLGITALVVLLICIFMRQQTRPIGILAETMRNLQKEQFKKRVEVKGTDEVRELAATYNHMVDELDNYIRQLLQVEADKRLAEIHALQMQINPHYMYNTLSSIKWLILQGDTGKSTRVIDAFISLLRNVISNTDECVTVDQEIDNLKNYVLLNQARYGDAVRVEFFVLPQCEQYKIPKLILQPFVENAFFHAFPEGGGGIIEIFVKEEGEYLRFDIVDNGVGIKNEQLLALNSKEKIKREHFTGIGIGNVDDRLKLIYGMDHGITILSGQGKGTTITLTLPKRKEEGGNS